MKNYYQILEVSENASPEVIEKAYKVLAKKYHPDTQPRDKLFWAEINFKEITEAYQVLSNSSLRKEYDMKLKYDNYNHQAQNNTQYKYNEYNNTNVNANNNTNATATDNISKEDSSSNFFNKKKRNTKNENTLNKEIMTSFKEIISNIPNLIHEEAKKPKEERSKDLKALVLTIIIVSIIIFIFWKVPFLKKLLFP